MTTFFGQSDQDFDGAPLNCNVNGDSLNDMSLEEPVNQTIVVGFGFLFVAQSCPPRYRREISLNPASAQKGPECPSALA